MSSSPPDFAPASSPSTLADEGPEYFREVSLPSPDPSQPTFVRIHSPCSPLDKEADDFRDPSLPSPDMPAAYFRPWVSEEADADQHPQYLRPAWNTKPDASSVNFMDGSEKVYLHPFERAESLEDLSASRIPVSVSEDGRSYETTHTAEQRPLNRLLQHISPRLAGSPQFSTPGYRPSPNFPPSPRFPASPSFASPSPARVSASPPQFTPLPSPALSRVSASRSMLAHSSARLSIPRSSITPSFFTAQSIVDSPRSFVDSFQGPAFALPSFPASPHRTASPMPSLASTIRSPSRLEVAQQFFAQEGLRLSPIIHMGQWTGLRVTEMFSGNPVPHEVLSTRLREALSGLPEGREETVRSLEVPRG